MSGNVISPLPLSKKKGIHCTAFLIPIRAFHESTRPIAIVCLLCSFLSLVAVAQNVVQAYHFFLFWIKKEKERLQGEHGPHVHWHPRSQLRNLLQIALFHEVPHTRQQFFIRLF